MEFCGCNDRAGAEVATVENGELAPVTGFNLPWWAIRIAIHPVDLPQGEPIGEITDSVPECRLFNRLFMITQYTCIYSGFEFIGLR